MTNSPLAVWSVFLSGILVALILLAGFVALVVLSQRRYLEQHRAHARRILEAQEAERAWVSREVHDGAVQWVGNLERECEHAEAMSGPATARIKAIRGELRDLAGFLRGVAHRLHPPVLERKGLSVALTMLCREIDDAGELEIEVRTPEQPIAELKPEAAVALYRIAQEALQNVRKHSGAIRASVTLTATDRAIELVVQDRGKGFEAGSGAPRGMGLLSMQERAVLAGGTAVVCSSVGQGTVVRATVPIPASGEG